ncbi:BREX-1 system adenine-specific DNA-methyltransferase PglX [Photobacterium damselae]|uniref:BREX-1 system adenine-specific DNA-methyltransferase PglX n=1 Tax=Photobacterium damselae TaxID=38293 RepID=UPI000E1DE8E3|nr:BREX-1 system adenine-specific DNA-methyltransferase PglX [Photobacterium damselae]RDL29032.1 type II restriction endonuclease [Photobacterium damselae]TMX48995.1 BREX-1 system adenine-specific DNA-methyltransferase PglX [Photobacterium damselae]TMX70466.1 BREX-1 system adenine-specific DNA-methyltransferase PglX [Photobacterium damselae]
MNTNKLKAYAPKARLAFMEAVTKRAAFLGLYAVRIAEMTIDGDSAVIEGRVFTRQQGQQRAQLVKRIEALGTNNGKFVLKDGFNQFINETAFTWFNRLTAIRYMEVNEYLDHGYRVLSNGKNAKFDEGFEILGSAANVADDLGLDKESIIDMVLDGNKEEELYRALLLGQCHQLSEAMPFMFEALDDATELLLPDNLTKTDSILKDLVNDIPEDNWQEIEVIGWLYQFYISEHKDAVIGKVVKREDIPAATQLFTPNWIVKYLVQNSLGRQWLATYPDSELKEKMEYYITPAEQSDDVIEQLKAITPTSIDPEEIKVLDPACGSGHILVEVYEVLREIYLERGYRPREIPELILTKNIYGLDIDDRAAQMAAFAVMMKAREDDKRIFSRDIKLNIHSIQSTENLNINQLWADLDLDGNQKAGSMGDLFAEPQLGISKVSEENKVYLDLLRYLKEQFIDAKNLGSLIDVDSRYQVKLAEVKAKLLESVQSTHQPTRKAVEALLPIVEQAILLANMYNIIIANPPYMGAKGMNSEVKKFAKLNLNYAKSDLFSMFIAHSKSLLCDNGICSMITMQSWMYLSSYEEFRNFINSNFTINAVAHLGPNAFPEITGPAIQLSCFSLRKCNIDNYRPIFGKYVAGNTEEKRIAVKSKSNLYSNYTISDFKKMPAQRLAYWIERELFKSFDNKKTFEDILTPRQGMATSDNNRFLRFWWEVSSFSINFSAKNQSDASKSQAKWFPYNKGGTPVRWFGNQEYVINWQNEGSELLNYASSLYGSPTRTIKNISHYFREGITWGDMTFKNKQGEETFAARYNPSGRIFDIMGPSGFPSEKDIYSVLAVLNSSVIKEYMSFMNPTSHFQVGDLKKIPFFMNDTCKKELTDLSKSAVKISKGLYSLNETSPYFNKKHLYFSKKLIQCINNEFDISQCEILKLSEIETKINKISTNLYRLNLTNINVDVQDITYKNKSTFLMCQDYISYAIGIMVGRYSLDREGLVYAHSGNNGFKELVAEGAYKTFPADDDGIVPLADEEWLFDDDATTRFREFVKTVWGEEHLSENLDFVAESLCLNAIKPKKGESSMDTIRRYFSTQFYKDHLKTYKKRPIYWLFSSGKEKAFECLVYLHRYNESTLSRMRTEYVTPLMGKLESRKNILDDSKATATGAELRAIDKELKTIDKKQAELVKFDEELKHLAEMKISIDLDDGVKVNYGKFGNLLADVKAIHGKTPEKIK